MSSLSINELLSPGISFLSGAVSSITARLIVYPFDTVKARLQVAKSTTKQNILLFMHNIWRKEGLISFYKGFGAVVIFAVPGGALYHGGFDLGRTLAPDIYPLPDMCSGLVAQLSANVAFTPMDVIKERRQAGIYSKNPLFDRELRRHFLAWRNVGDIFRGFWITNSLWVPWSMCYAMGYNYLKKEAGVETEPLSIGAIFGCACTAAAIATTITHPIDVVKTQLQVYSSNQVQLHAVTVVKKLLRSEGIRGFYRGFTARLMNISPQAGLAWLLFELIRIQINELVV